MVIRRLLQLQKSLKIMVLGSKAVKSNGAMRKRGRMLCRFFSTD